VREFRLTSQGPELVDVVIGPQGVITGSSRLIFEDKQKRLALSSLNEMKRKHRSLQRHRLEIESQIELLRSQFQEDSDELELITLEEESAVEIEASLGLLRSQHRGEIQ
jgi:circadian clock protein KaiC